MDTSDSMDWNRDLIDEYVDEHPHERIKDWMPGGSDMEQRIADQEEMNREIHDRLTPRDVLEALAEESAELGQAALKMIRAFRIGWCNNVTPVTPQEALDNLAEEIADVELVVEVLRHYYAFNAPLGKIMDAKRSRWLERLKEWKEKYKQRSPRFEELAKQKGGQK